MFDRDPLTHRTVSVILGGGQGTRLFPLTRDRSKPAVPLGGKFRFVDVALSNAINSGLTRIFVLTQYNSTSLNNHVTRTYKFDNFSKGFVTLLAAEERFESEREITLFQGTADAVRQSLRYINSPDFENILVIPGDHLCRINFHELLEKHDEQHADVTLCAAVVGREQIGQFRAFRLSDDGRVAAFAKRPDTEEMLARFRLSDTDKFVHRIPKDEVPDEAFLAFTGIYLFRREVLVELLEKVDGHDLAHDVLPNILFGNRCVCHVFSGYWRDIGTIRQFYDASMDLTQPSPTFRFSDPEAPIYSQARYLPGASVYSSQLEGVLLSDGAQIYGAQLERSVIGVRTVIQPGSVVSHSVIFGADTFEGDNRRAAALGRNGQPSLGIGEGCEIRRAIIDKNARIGAGCRLTNVDGVETRDASNYFIRNGIIIIPKNAVLPPGTVI